MSRARERPQQGYLEPNSHRSEYHSKAILTIRDRETSRQYYVRVEEADIYYSGFSCTTVETGSRFDNVCRCWAQLEGRPGDWEHERVRAGVKTIKRVLVDEEKYRGYTRRWNDHSTDARDIRARASDEYARLIKEWYGTMVQSVKDVAAVPMHVFDTITMATQWLGTSDHDIATTLTYLYAHTKMFSEKEFAPIQDIKGAEVRYLRQFYRSFFLEDHEYKWWHTYRPTSNPRMPKEHREYQMSRRLMQMPWMWKFIEKDSKFTARIDGYKFFNYWVSEAKKWAAQRSGATPMEH
ncbi:MAG: hypothetical protein L6R36_003651 [Xanthoria steineri]|nr:MAG: hypothetical protein L6R36_003651 [Xanthoria steineri]